MLCCFVCHASSYILSCADVPGTFFGTDQITHCWNAIAKAVAICNDIGIPVLIGGFRGRYWYHLVSRTLLESRAMLETQHRWCAFRLVPFNREDNTSMTDAQYTSYHNNIFDIQHAPCSCAADTSHIRFDLRIARSQSRSALKANEQAFLQQLPSLK